MKKDLIGALAWAGFMLALAYAATLAHRMGYIGGDTVERLAIGVTGFWLVWYGNRIPKKLVRGAQARKTQRVSGWSQVLSGLVYTGLWAFAPIPVATWAGPGAIFAGVAFTFIHCLASRDKAETA